MKILIISNLYPPNLIGGYEIACKNVAEELISRGHDVKVLTSSGLEHGILPYVSNSLDLRFFDPEHPKKEGLVKQMLFDAKASILHNTYTVASEITLFEPDIVYVWNLLGVGGLGILSALNLYGCKWVMHLMDSAPVYLTSGFPSAILEIFGGTSFDLFLSGFYIAMSKGILDEIKNETGLNLSGKVEIVPGWVNSKDLPSERSVRNKDFTRFVFSGTVKEHKGIDLIISAASILLNKYQGRFAIDIYGDGDISYYTEMASQAGLKSVLHFHGPKRQKDLFSLYPTYDSFLFPTWEREPFGFAPLEAAACGCLPIITSTCGIAERLIDQIHCIKIRRNSTDLAAAMEKVINNDIDINVIAQANFSLCAGSLDFERCVSRIERILSRQATVQNKYFIPQNKRRLIKLQHDIARRLLNHW